MIASASTEIELELTRLIGVASSNEISGYGTGAYGKSAYGGIPNVVARAALGALESMNSRIAVVRAILKVSVSEALCEEFETLARGIRKAAGQRNDVVHQVWSKHESYPEDLLAPTEDPGIYQRYTVKCLDSILDRLDQERLNIVRFKMTCASDRAARLQRQGLRRIIPSPLKE